MCEVIFHCGFNCIGQISGKVPNVELPLSSPCRVMDRVTYPALMCDNIYGKILLGLDYILLMWLTLFLSPSRDRADTS